MLVAHLGVNQTKDKPSPRHGILKQTSPGGAYTICLYVDDVTTRQVNLVVVENATNRELVNTALQNYPIESDARRDVYFSPDNTACVIQTGSRVDNFIYDRHTRTQDGKVQSRMHYSFAESFASATPEKDEFYLPRLYETDSAAYAYREDSPQEENPRLNLIDMVRGIPRHPLGVHIPVWPESLAINHNATRVAFGNHAKLFLKDLTLGFVDKKALRLDEPKGIHFPLSSDRRLFWNNNGSFIAAAYPDGHVAAWDADTRKLAFYYKPFGLQASFVNVSYSGKALAAAYADKILVVYRDNDKVLTRNFHTKGSQVDHLDVSLNTWDQGIPVLRAFGADDTELSLELN